MSCLCFPRKHRDRPFFHWPNFTWSRSEHSINPRRIHSTFSLAEKHTPGRRHPPRRHTLHNGTTLAHLRKPRESRHSVQTTETAPPIVTAVDDAMTDRYAPPPGPPPSDHAQQSTSKDDNAAQHHVQFASAGNRDREEATHNPFRKAYTHATQVLHPSKASDQPPQYVPPPGEPPSSTGQQPTSQHVEYAPPSGPPPSQDANEDPPPPYDPWLAVPDNSSLPPPPSIREERSPTANASAADARRAHDWCRQNHLWPPHQPDRQTLQRISAGEISLTSAPDNANARLMPSPRVGKTFVCNSGPDTIFLSDIPLYTAYTRSPHTIYYEVQIVMMGRQRHHHGEADAGIAVGFLAPPYPSWRLPGWHRGSLAVHGDDGRRYVDNSYGGQPFTSAFRKGDVVGIGVTFSPASRTMGGKQHCRVFFTRNGRMEGGWDLHEERDREEDGGDVRGLEGDHDLLAAVGCFGEVEFEVRFKREQWMFRP